MTASPFVENRTGVRELLGYEDRRPFLRVVDLDARTVKPAGASPDGARQGISEVISLRTWLAVRCGYELWSLPLPMDGKAEPIVQSIVAIPDVVTDSVWVQPLSNPGNVCFRVDQNGQQIGGSVVLPPEARARAITPQGWIIQTESTYHLWSDGRLNPLGAGFNVGITETSLVLVDPSDISMTVVDLASGRTRDVSVPVAKATWDWGRSATSYDGELVALPVDLKAGERVLAVVDIGIGQSQVVRGCPDADLGFVWSADSQWLFAACSGARGSDVLYAGSRSQRFEMHPIIRGSIPLLLKVSGWVTTARPSFHAS